MPTLKLDHIVGANLSATEQVIQTPARPTVQVITEYHRRAYITDICTPLRFDRPSNWYAVPLWSRGRGERGNP